jgi:hypothetical protein
MQSAFWLVTGTLVFYNSGIYINILLIINGLLFILFAFMHYRNTLFKIACAGFLVANTVLTLTDQAGLADYLILASNILCIISFAVILFGRKPSK